MRPTSGGRSADRNDERGAHSDRMSAEAGWYHAEGDGAGLVRYWNGAGWIGEAVGTPGEVPPPTAAAVPAENWFVRLISPSGRVNRKTYAASSFGISVLYVVGVVACVAIALTGWTEPAIAMLMLLLFVFVPFAGWLFIATSSKRLHDQGMSAWWLLMTIVPFGGPVLSLLCLLAPGTAGPNRHGPEPGPGVRL